MTNSFRSKAHARQLFLESYGNISVTGLNTRHFDSIFSCFQISHALPHLFLQSLMGDYDVGVWSSISNMETTLSILGI